MRRILLSFWVGTLIVAGCAPSVQSMSPTMPPTPSLSPNSTRTLTPNPTQTRPPSRKPAPSLTPAPSVTPSLTSTATPTSIVVSPLTAHKWLPQTVLLKMESGGGDGCCLYSYPAELVLYADGRLIVRQGYEANGEWRRQLMTKVLSRAELCSVLNTVDQTGFLDYSPAAYRPQNSDYFSIDGSDSTIIAVNSWRSNFGNFFALSSYLRFSSMAAESGQSILDDPGAPVIPPALRDMYYFLESLKQSDAEVYQPERLGLIVTKYESVRVQPDSPIIDWPFNELSLAEIEKFTSDGYSSQFYIVEGRNAASIYDYFNNSFGFYGENVRQNGQVYVVFLRPILPYEIPLPEEVYNILPDPAVEPPQFELECHPSDGIMTIPTPTPSSP